MRHHERVRFLYLPRIIRKMWPAVRGTQRECSSKPLKRSIVKRILVFKR